MTDMQPRIFEITTDVISKLVVNAVDGKKNHMFSFAIADVPYKYWIKPYVAGMVKKVDEQAQGLNIGDLAQYTLIDPLVVSGLQYGIIMVSSKGGPNFIELLKSNFKTLILSGGIQVFTRTAGQAPPKKSFIY